jgi:uncharacterized protein
MTSLKQAVQDAMKEAMRAKDKLRLGTLRLIKAEITRFEVDNREDADDKVMLGLLTKMNKQRRDSAKQYQDADRPELAKKELDEIAVIQDFLPQPLSEEAIAELITSTIADLDATSMKDMGKVMGVLTAKMQGRADMSQVSAKIKSVLQS